MNSRGCGKEIVTLGPWGGQGGLRWNDGICSTIRQIEIAHGAGIDSIKFEYDKNGASFWSEKHGGTGGSRTDRARLDYPDEFLISIHGHCGSLHGGGPVCVRSLTFQTNKRKFGPFGVEQGTPFSLPMTKGKVVGFHGHAGWYLDGIGVYFEPLEKSGLGLGHSNGIIHHSQHHVSHGTEKYEYSMIQGNFDNNYELVVALKRKDDTSNFHPEIHPKPMVNLQRHKDEYSNFHPENHPKPMVNLQNHKDGNSHFYPESHPKPMLNLQNHKDGSSNFHPESHPKPMVNLQNHKDGNGHFHRESHPNPTANHHEVKHSEHKKKVSSVVPAKTEKVPSRKRQGVSTCGPWGGTGGSMFDDGVYDGIRQINISRNVGIVSIKVCYELNGQTVWGAKNGGTGGFTKHKIVFDYPSEILTCISGYHHPTMVMGPTIIRSLTFHTTKAKYGPYGEEKGQPFSSNLQQSGMIVGVHGKGGLFIDAIGVHVLEGKVFPPPPSSSPSKPVNRHPVPVSNGADNTNSQWSLKLGKKWLTEDEAVQRIVKDSAPYGPGPWGGEGGKPWDDGVYTGIKQIILSSCEMAICCLEIEYDRNGQSVWSVKHGGHGGKTTHRVKLDYPNEVLTCISGYYGPINQDQGMKVIKSLTFYTTRGKLGPFGQELGSYFTSNTTEGKVLGFHGRSGIYLDAIGVHMQHWLGYQRATKPSSLKKMFS